MSGSVKRKIAFDTEKVKAALKDRHIKMTIRKGQGCSQGSSHQNDEPVQGDIYLQVRTLQEHERGIDYA
jgi:hypothetical protein